MQLEDTILNTPTVQDDFKNDDDEDEDDDELSMDMSWINTWESKQKLFSDFYEEPVELVQMVCLYIEDGAVVGMTKDQLHLRIPGLLFKEDMIMFIKQHQNWQQHHYKLQQVLTFYLDLQADELRTFLLSDEPDYQARFLKAHNYLLDAKFDHSIGILQDLNTVFVLYKSTGPIVRQSAPKSSSNGTLTWTRRLHVPGLARTKKHHK